jgi:putative salt-induced outer membrane protein YdiY
MLPGLSLADEVIMKDGSRLVGTVVKKEGDVLEFKTSFAGTVKVNWNEVVELKTDEPTTIMLDNEEVIIAQVIRNEDGMSTVVRATEEESYAYQREQLAFINPEPWRLGTGYKFSGRVNLAVEYQRGNTDTDEIDLDGSLLWRKRRDRVRLSGEVERDKSEGKLTADNWKANSKYDRFVTEKWYVGGALFAEADDFADLNLRVGAGPGLGYQFFESKPLNLSVEAGLMAVHEEFKNDPDDNYPALGWQVDFDKFLVPDLLQLYHLHTGLWNLEDTGDLVWNTWTGLRVPLLFGLVASTEANLEYDSGAAEGADEWDQTYTIKLGYQW